MNKGFLFNNACISYKLLINPADVKSTGTICDFIRDAFTIIKSMYCMYALHHTLSLLINWNWKKSPLTWKDLDW